MTIYLTVLICSSRLRARRGNHLGIRRSASWERGLLRDRRLPSGHYRSHRRRCTGTLLRNYRTGMRTRLSRRFQSTEPARTSPRRYWSPLDTARLDQSRCLPSPERTSLSPRPSHRTRGRCHPRRGRRDPRRRAAPAPRPGCRSPSSRRGPHPR